MNYIGMKAQETLLGTYITEAGKKKEIVACKDFTGNGYVLSDAYIGNWDRHNGNWVFLYNQDTDDVKIAPLYDSGSSLYPQADEKIISSLENYECTQALVRMTPRIDNAEQKIFKLIDDISCISNIQKQFYKTMLKERKEKIIDYSFDLAMKQKCIKKTEGFTSNKQRGR